MPLIYCAREIFSVVFLNMDKETISYIINILRLGTVTWARRTECLNRGRRQKLVGKMKNGKDKFLWENDCEVCGEWHELKKNLFEVDHIDEVGPFLGDFNAFIPRMYCELSNLQRLCVTCHLRKTSRFNSLLRYSRKEIKLDPHQLL
jgi:hypothetical protein